MEKTLFLYFNVATCWKLSTMVISSQIDSTAKIGHPECIKHDLEHVYWKQGFLYFNVASCWKLSTMFISSQIDSTGKIGHPECIKHDLELVYGKRLFMYVATCWKLSTLFISSRINRTFFFTSRVQRIWFRAFHGKVVISVFQCCNLLKTVHNVNFISNRQHSQNWASRVHQTWFRACLWKKVIYAFYSVFITSRINRTFFFYIQSASNMI